MPLDEMPLAFSKICRMETRSILTRAIGRRNTSIFEGNSCRPILNGDDVKQRKDLEVTTNVSPLGSVTLLADFFFRIRFNVSAMHWIQGTKGPFIYYVSTFFHQPQHFHEFLSIFLSTKKIQTTA